MKNIVGYIHTAFDGQSGIVQENLILDYCKIHNLKLHKMFLDDGIICCMKADGNVRNFTQSRRGVSARKELLKEIEKGQVDSILVDSVVRLTVKSAETENLMELCEVHGVEIIEVSLNKEGDEAKKNRVAVYHNTGTKTSRVGIVEWDVDQLYDFISKHIQWKCQGLYLDFGLTKSKQPQYVAVQNDMQLYDILLAKSCFHIQAKTSTFWSHVMQFHNHNIRLETLVDGSIKLRRPHTEFSEDYKIAIYHKQSDKDSGKCLRVEVLESFVTLKTCWSVEEIYIDRDDRYGNEQPELDRLISEADMYDLIVVDDFATIHFRTIKFMKFAKVLQKPIFSIKEGGIYKYEESRLL